MAQNTKEERLRIAQIEIVQAYINSLTYSNGNPLNTRTQYANVTNALDALNPQYLKQLTEKLATRKNIKNLLFEINKQSGKLGRTYKSYVTQFVTFLSDPTNVTSLNGICKNYLNSKQSAALSNNAGTIYFHNALFTSFKGRLRSQERLSGNKIWLPLRFIAKLYSIHAPKRTTRFTLWLSKLVDGIYVHYLDGSQVKSKKFYDPDISLILKQNSNNLFNIYLREFNKKNWTDYPVLTPTGDGNKKDYMVVKDISEIDIDHVKPIDQSLRELDNKGLLTCLKDVSNFYKINIPKKANAGDLNKAARIFAKNKGANFSVFLNNLLNELDLLGNDSPLRLMSDVYNSQKSNAFPYEKIIYDNRVYYGILRTGIKDPIIVNRNYEIYQILNDDFQNSGITYVRQQSSITKRPINKLNKIINYI